MAERKISDTSLVPEKEDVASACWNTGTLQAEVVTLRDGTTVTIRPIRPDDAPRLQALFDRLSPESVFLRFLGHQKALPDKQAQVLANVDYHVRMAWVASLEHEGEEQVVAVARYAVIREDMPDLAEAAIAVEDRFQGRGLGRLLFRRLADYALGHGIRAFWGPVYHSNARVMSLVQGAGFPINRRNIGCGVWEIEIVLEPEADPEFKCTLEDAAEPAGGTGSQVAGEPPSGDAQKNCKETGRVAG